MGSFNLICSMSGLPITCGEKVRVMLLGQNPYHQGAGVTCYTYDRWWPRTLPLRAVYEDSGSVEHPDGRPDWDGIDGWLWRRSLELDVVVRGVGENEYHDVPVKAGMTIHQYLDAAYEDRLQIQRERERPVSESYEKWAASMRQQPKSGIPLLEDIQTRLEGMEYKFFVDSDLYGEARVRLVNPSGVEDPEAVLKMVATTHLNEFATMVYAGEYHPELLLRPKPGTPDFHGLRKPFSQEPLQVGNAVIREDVWQAALSMSEMVEHYGSDKHVAFDAYLKDFTNAFKEHREALKTRDEYRYRLQIKLAERNRLTGGVLKSPIPLTVGLGEAWGLFIEEGVDKFGEESAQTLVRDFAEFACIQDVNMHFHNDWRLTRYGSQSVEIKDWAKYMRKLGKVASDAAKEWKW